MPIKVAHGLYRENVRQWLRAGAPARSRCRQLLFFSGNGYVQPHRVSLNTDRTTAHDRTAFTIARRPTADCSRPFHRPTARPHVVNDPIIANYPTTHSNDISTHGPTVITIIAFYTSCLRKYVVVTA